MTQEKMTRSRGNGDARPADGRLAADREVIAAFVHALFAYADGDSYASLRTFTHRRGDKPVEIRAARIGDDLGELVAKATGAATRAARHERPTVFAPPVCTFRGTGRAREEDLVNGLALSVELDVDPLNAIGRLDNILGLPTVLVGSGGSWVSAETGEVASKLHAHWRLVEPTRTQAEHARLKRARAIATALVGGDGSAVPLVHPLRWPGSWHLKEAPVLASIIQLKNQVEIELGDALERLEDAARARVALAPADERRRLKEALALGAAPPRAASGPDVSAADADLEALADAIGDDGGSYAEWIKVGYAFHASSGGSPAGFQAWDRWSRKSPNYGGTGEQWAKFDAAPPERTGIGALVKRAKAANPAFRLPSKGPARTRTRTEAPIGQERATGPVLVAGTDFDQAVADLAALPPSPERDAKRRAIASSYKVRSRTIDQAAERLSSDGEEDGRRERGPSQRDKILLVCADLELWHDEDGAGYCTVEVSGHLEHLALRGRGFRTWLTRRFGEKFKSEIAGREVATGFTEQAFQDARRGLEAEAMGGAEHPPFHRVGGDHEHVVLDLGRDDWRMAEVTADGWRIVERCATKMVRTPGMRPLPLPERGGTVDELADLLNFGQGEDAAHAFKLYVGALVAALAPSLNRLIMAVSGEQGSGKSTLTSTFKALVDPHRAMRRSLPANSEDLFIAAASTHVLLFDNVSELQGWIADDLARIATGGSLGKRTKFSDTEETYLTVRCPIVLNGIPDLATRADLADRAVVLKLPALPDDQRRDEADLEADLAMAAPRVLGALLDGVAAALRNRDDVAELIRLQPRRPRMVDATIWVEAAAEAFGWPRWAFLAAYNANRSEAVEIALEADVVAEAIRAFMADKVKWSGQAKPLLEHLAGFINERTLKAKDWPRTGHHLSNRLRRSQPGLRRIGIQVEWHRSNTIRTIQLARIPSETQNDA